MRDLIGLSYIVGIIWMVAKLYTYRWKLKNPGKPAFRWTDRVGNSCSGSNDPMFTSDSSSDKWLSPGGITTEYYSYHSQADQDFQRNHPTV